MTDLVDFHHRALARLTDTIEGIGADDWQRPTACADWAVRDLVGHLTAEAHWAPHLLRGESLSQVGDRYDGDVLGEDPHGAWRAASDDERRAVAAPGALDGTVDTSMGELPASVYLAQRLTDLAVHRWDLARGLGVDGSIPDDIAEFLYEMWEPQADELASTGIFAPRVEVPADASATDRVVALLGRAP